MTNYAVCMMIDAYQYLLGEYLIAGRYGESIRQLSIMDALRIIDKAECCIPFYATLEDSHD